MIGFSRALWFVPLVAIAAAAPLTARAEADVYGKLMLGLENVDDENETGDFWQVESYASRFGVKGSAETDVSDIDVIYKLEWEVDVSDEKDSADNHIKARNQYVGLEGGFGRFIVGRHDTPFKKAQGDLDLFNDIADIKLVMAGGENREDNIYQYTTPAFAGGVSVTVMGIAREDPAAGEDGPADATSVSVNYAGERLYLAAAMDSDVEGDDTDASRLVAFWKSGPFGLGGLVQSSDFGTGEDEEVGIVSAYYKVDRLKFKAQAGSTSNYAGVAGRDADLAVFGVDYAFSDRTVLGGYFSSEEGGDVGAGLNRDTFGMLLIHKF